MISQKAICYSSTRNHYGFDVITKVLRAEDTTISASIDNTSNNIGSSGSIYNKDVYFLICNMCFWFASLYPNTNISLSNGIKCPVCKNNRNLESIPLSRNESFKINHDSRRGIVLEFSQ
jgi:hypothetical protein